MYIGTLLKVLCINEDSQSAFKARIKNRAYKDPNTIVGITYDGSHADFENKAKSMMPRKYAKKFNKVLETEKEQTIKNWKKEASANGASKEEINNYDFEKYYNDIKRTKGLDAAAYDPRSKIIGVNTELDSAKYTTTSNGNINTKDKIWTHEKQHAIQDTIKNDLAKNKSKRHADELVKKYDKEVLKTKGIIYNYPNNIDSQNIHYNTSPYEFDANAAANRGYNSAGKGTIRAAMQMSNQWPGRQIKPKPSHADELQQRMDGIHYPPQIRVKNERRLQMQLHPTYKQQYIQNPNQGKSSTTPLPKKTQEFVEKESNRMTKQIQNGRTFTNKDLENAQPLRQNPIPRKQR